LGDSHDSNDEEIQKLVEIANLGYADLIAVGNEVLYREDLNEEELLQYIDKVKQQLPDIPVGYVDAYYEFCNRPAIVDACDIIFTNCYPFWEGCQIDYSLLYMRDMFRRVVDASKGKRVIITETGWPNRGTAVEDAQPSLLNAIKYFINAQLWSTADGIEMFYFSAFDELWKVDVEGDVGAYWGIWDKDGNLKYGV
jgi:exo-beta-1,3-glucanase (GH17 family)